MAKTLDDIFGAEGDTSSLEQSSKLKSLYELLLTLGMAPHQSSGRTATEGMSVDAELETDPELESDVVLGALVGDGSSRSVSASEVFFWRFSRAFKLREYLCDRSSLCADLAPQGTRFCAEPQDSEFVGGSFFPLPPCSYLFRQVPLD